MAILVMAAPKATILAGRLPDWFDSTVRFITPHSHMRYWSKPPALYRVSRLRSNTFPWRASPTGLARAVPTVSMTSTSNPSSLKSPSSRATSTDRS